MALVRLLLVWLLWLPPCAFQHSFHQFSRHQFPSSPISDEFNKSADGLYQMLCLFSEIYFLPLEILVGGCRSWRILQRNYRPIESQNDRQRCYSIPEQQEYKTLKKKRFSGNFSEIQVAMRKEKQSDICVCFESGRSYGPLSLQALVQSIRRWLSMTLEPGSWKGYVISSFDC